MKLKSINKSNWEGRATLEAEIESEHFDGVKKLFFRYAEKFNDFLTTDADPFLPALLIPAMRMNEDLEVTPPLSNQLLNNQQRIQDILTTWHPEHFHRITVTASGKINQAKQKPGLDASMFSLGVDSMYTMLKHLSGKKPDSKDGYSALIYMKGMELPLNAYDKGQDKEVIKEIEKLADHYGLTLIIGETNLRDIFPLDWEDEYFGPGLAATALSLSRGLNNVYIPSSHSYATLFHDPSSPLLDHLWSTENTNIIHDGGEKERAEKIVDTIIHDPKALNSLRVCVENEGGSYNCGKCWKCIRTMITLEIVDKLKDCKAFPDKLPPYSGIMLKTYIPDSLEFTKENLKLAKKYGKTGIAKKLEREIRIGKVDIFRNGKPISFVLSEMLYYFSVKLAKKTGIIK